MVWYQQFIFPINIFVASCVDPLWLDACDTANTDSRKTLTKKLDVMWIGHLMADLYIISSDCIYHWLILKSRHCHMTDKRVQHLELVNKVLKIQGVPFDGCRQKSSSNIPQQIRGFEIVIFNNISSSDIREEGKAAVIWSSPLRTVWRWIKQGKHRMPRRIKKCTFKVDAIWSP